MDESHPLFSLMLSQSQFMGPTEQLEETLKPMPSQYAIKPGDKCLAATANTMLEEDFTLMEVLEPDSHPELFPDWEERSGWGSHVLTQWFSVDCLEGDIGWFSRVKLIPITEEQYAECELWRTGDFPDAPPKWIEEAFTSYTDSLAHLAPDSIPVLVTCPKCQGREVELHTLGKKRSLSRAGELKRGDKTVYVPLNNPEESTEWAAHLLCKSCGAIAQLEDEEWELPQ
jgi:hypothetical protein